MPERDDDRLIQQVVADLRAPVPDDPTIEARIMTVVRAERPPSRSGTLRSAWRWLREPRAMRLSPLAGLAAAAAIAAIVWLGAGTRNRMDAAARAPDQARPAAPVQFVLVAPGARTVAVVGDFNDWDPTATPLSTVGRGELWSVIVPLPPGRHRYSFLVDGSRWVADPTAPLAADDDYGTPNSVVTVGT